MTSYFKTTLIIITVFLPLSIFGQKITPPEGSSTRNIKDIYKYVQSKINRNQYYLNEYKTNSKSLPWVKGAKYQSTQQYYYSFVGDNTPVLRLVVVMSKVDDKNYYTEFLFDLDGNVSFCHEKQNDEGRYKYRNFEAYYENNLCINLFLDDEIINPEDTSHTTKLNLLMAQANFYARRFKEDMKQYEY